MPAGVSCAFVLYVHLSKLQTSTSGRSAAAPESRSRSWSPNAVQAPAQADDKKGTTSSKRQNNKYEVIVDEDDDVMLDDDDENDDFDYEVLDEDLQAFKRLRPAEIRQLGSTAAAPARGTSVAGAAAAAAAAGLHLKAQRKQRRVLPETSEPGRKSSVGGASSARSVVWGAGRSGSRKWEGVEDGGRRVAAPSRGDVMQDLHRELDELRGEKERQQHQWRTRGGSRDKSY